MSLFKVDEQGNLIFPTVNDIYQKYSISTKPLDFVSNYFKNTLNLGDMKVIPIISNPNTPDSDNDGLYDQVARYVDIYDGSLEKYKTIKVVPPDPDPLKANAPAGIWDEHCKQQASGKRVAHKLEGTYGVDILSLIGSAGLTFEVDDKYIAIHSKEEQWQKAFGFTDFYDSVFKFATNENMDRLKVEYKSQSPYDDEPINHILWLWRGDYLNIGTGGEIGIYYDDDGNDLWTVEKFRLPMTLETYNYYGENHIENIFCWSPYEKQWWITGFNPELREPDVKDVLLLGSVDYSEYPNMYSDLKRDVLEAKNRNKEIYDSFIFDDEDYTVWIVWWSTDKYPLT